jgi:hypothetical protein
VRPVRAQNPNKAGTPEDSVNLSPNAQAALAKNPTSEANQQILEAARNRMIETYA